MQLVVVIAVRNAVSAATTTFTAISMIRFFIRYPSLVTCVYRVVVITASGSAGVDHKRRSLSRHSEATAIHPAVLRQLNARTIDISGG